MIDQNRKNIIMQTCSDAMKVVGEIVENAQRAVAAIRYTEDSDSQCMWCGQDVCDVHCDSKNKCVCGASLYPGSGGRCTNGDCSNCA